MSSDVRAGIYLTGTKPLIPRDWLNAHSYLHGRTRMLMATIEDKEWDSTMGQPVMTFKVGYIRSGLLAMHVDHGRTAVSGTSTLTVTFKKVSDNSTVGTLTTTAATAYTPRWSAYGTVDIGTALYAEVSITGAAGQFRNLAIYEIMETPDTGGTPQFSHVNCLWANQPPFNPVSHGDAATYTRMNFCKSDRPSTELKFAQRYGLVYTTNLTSDILKIEKYIDPFLGRYMDFCARLRCPTDGANTITSQCDIVSLDGTLVDSKSMTATGTAWTPVRIASPFDLETLTNNGDIHGIQGRIRIRLKSGNGASVELSGARVHSGDYSTSADFPY